MPAGGLVCVHIPEAIDFHDGFVMAIETSTETRRESATVCAILQTLDGDIVEIRDREPSLVGEGTAPQLGESHRNSFEFRMQRRLTSCYTQDLIGSLPAFHGSLPAFHARDGAYEFFERHVLACGLVRHEACAVRALQMALCADIDLNDAHLSWRPQNHLLRGARVESGKVSPLRSNTRMSRDFIEGLDNNRLRDFDPA